MQPAFVDKRAVYRLHHFPGRILLNIYPLSRSEYGRTSMPRRASYSYLNETIETTYKVASSLVRQLEGDSFSTKSQCFRRATALRLWPSSLGDALIRLGHLRDEVTHDNPTVDVNLTVYDCLLELMLVGFAAYELFVMLHRRADAEPPGPVVDRTIDAGYVRRVLARCEGTPSIEAKAHAAERRLEREHRVPAYSLRADAVADFARRLHD